MKRFRTPASLIGTGRLSLAALALLLFFPLAASAAQDRTHRASERDVAPPATHVLDLLRDSPLENSRRASGEEFGPLRQAQFLLSPEAHSAFDRSALELSYGSTEYGFDGREQDSESGLQFFRARSYDPMTGRFTSRDPVEHPNLYVFAENAPTNYTDPSGEDIQFGGDEWLPWEKEAVVKALSKWTGLGLELSVATNGEEHIGWKLVKGLKVGSKPIDTGGLPGWLQSKITSSDVVYVEDILEHILDPKNYGEGGEKATEGFSDLFEESLWQAKGGKPQGPSFWDDPLGIKAYYDSLKNGDAVETAVAAVAVIGELAGAATGFVGKKQATEYVAEQGAAAAARKFFLSQILKGVAYDSLTVAAKRRINSIVNKAVGKVGEEVVLHELESSGFKILGTQVRVKIGATTRIADFLVQDARGFVYFVESKAGGAYRKASQIAGDRLLFTRGGVIQSGERLAEGFVGRTIKAKTVVRGVK